MGFISGADKLQAAQQIKQWFDSANNNIDNVIALKASITNQLEAMKINSDYSPSDILEVETLISDLNKKILAV
jgi:hypothetical protein